MKPIHKKSCLILILSAAGLFLICSCRGPEGNTASGVPRRVVSLSPSITRQLADMGTMDVLAGVTVQDSVAPDRVPRVGTMVSPNFESVLALKPDMVFSSEEDGATQNLDALKHSGIRLHRFPGNRDFAALCRNYMELAAIMGLEAGAREKIAAYAAALERCRRGRSGTGVLFLVAHEPLVTVSDHSFVGHILSDAGGDNIFADAGVPYPVISAEAVVTRNPMVIIVMSPGGDAAVRKMFRSFPVSALKNGRVHYLEPEHVAYYTPADYVEAVREISSLLKKDLKYQR